MCVCRYVCDHEYSLLAHFPQVCSSLTIFQKTFFSLVLSSHLSLSTCPSFTAIVPLFSIIHLTVLHYPSLFQSFSLQATHLPLPHPPSYHSFLYSSSMILFFHDRKKKKSPHKHLSAGCPFVSSPSKPFPALALAGWSICCIGIGWFQQVRHSRAT